MNPTLGLLLPLALAQPPSAPPLVQASCQTCPTPVGSVVPPPLPALWGGVTVPPHLLSVPKPRDLCPPVGPPAPLLAVKPILADGYTLTVDGTDRTFAGGSVFGFRPGFVYRLKFTHPTDPALSVGGTLEVRGSIVPRPNMKYMEFPAAVGLNKTDLKAALGGGIVSKVIYLEDPEKALPLEQKADDPLEVAADTEREALDLARVSGRVVAVLRVGGRVPSKQELTEAFIDGTVLLPGESALGRPGVPPPLECSAVPLYDPILGPKVSEDECFPNGGDRGPRIGIGPGGRLGNLNVTDAAMEFTRGSKREAVVSNVVCLCSPRFVSRRAEGVAAAVSIAFSPAEMRQVFIRNVFVQRLHAEELVGRERTLGLVSRLRPGATVQYIVLQALVSTQGLKGTASTRGPAEVAVVVQLDEISLSNRLALTKTVDPPGPYQSGDEVTITLRYANNTRQEIRDLAVSDSLSPRLEYVTGSAMADRRSTITTSTNEAGGTVIRFDIPGPIPPNAEGVAVFKVKVR
jgi:hypothetical protein